MPTSPFSGTVQYIILLSLCFISPAAAFGAGNIPDKSGLFGFNGRHGDIATLLLSIPITLFASSTESKKLNMKRVYFGNWLRDYSQIMDVSMFQKAPEEVLRAIVSILGFIEFGYATKEFDITRERLGIYRPEEHIDNPRGYTNTAKKEDERLRGPVVDKELDIDPKTGMKNYISNESLGIATSSAYIRRELQLAIEQGRQRGQNQDSKYEAFRHLGAALHTLEDFSAHSNYVELCLLLLGKQRPENSLDNVFAYVGDAAVVQTQAGPAPPIVTGSFGPLDIIESLLGEIDDKMATGKLNELALRLPPSNSSELTSTIETLQTALKMGESIGLIPKDFNQKVQSLKSSTAASSSQSSTWQEVNRNPSGIWNTIEPFFKVRDEIVKWLQESGSDLNFFTSALAKISAAIDKMIFAALANIVGPILGDVRTQLEVEKDFLLQEEKAAAKDPESDIFSSCSKATNPSHSQISKDHFDCVLNIPAAQVAAVVTSFTTRQVAKCWDDPSLEADEVIRSILKTLHHPFNVEFKNPDHLQRDMFRAATEWWTDKTDQQRDFLRHRLIKSTIAAGEHRYLIKNPEEWRNHPSFGKKPAEDKSLVDTVVDNITDAVKKGAIDISQPVLTQIVNVMQSLPTSDTPNTVDEALSKIPGAIPAFEIFKGVSPQAFMAAPTMGSVLKDVFSFW